MRTRNIKPNASLKNGQQLINAYINIEYILPCVYGFDSESLEPVYTQFYDVTWLDDNFEDTVKSSDQPARTPADKVNIIASQTIGRKYANAYDTNNSRSIYNAFIVDDEVYGYTNEDKPIICPLGDIRLIEGEELPVLYSGNEIDWETRRYEIAKSNLAALINIEALKCFKYAPTRELYVKAAVAYADALIEELKK